MDKPPPAAQRRRRRKILLRLLILWIITIVAWQLLRPHFSEQERQIRSQLRHTIEQRFPQQAAEANAHYGLKPFPAGRPLNLSRPQVVLIHGLDDPGKIWMNLAPTLAKTGFSIWLMNYPDDQPISDSAELFHQQLQWLQQQGVSSITIIAHSMGGLVSRDLLSRPEWLTDKNIPQVSQLILVGTPNQGSELARLRFFAELRDQFAEIPNGEFGWLNAIFDGAGEAGLDLTPGSPFLTQLNSRPAPPDTRIMVIAGQLGQIDKQRLQTAIANHRETLPEGTEVALLQLFEQIEAALAILGDGLVSLNSARLPGAEFHTVSGTHLSIIRNISTESQRVPPAIPLILQLLTPTVEEAIKEP